MSDDLVTRLRAEALIADEDWTGIYQISPNLAFAAADRIEKLEAALREITVTFWDRKEIEQIVIKALEGK